MARCGKILRALATKLKVVKDITFLSKIGVKVWSGLIRSDKMWQDVTKI